MAKAFDPELEQFAGRVVDIEGAITFYGVSVDDLKREMATSVDEYLAFCEASPALYPQVRLDKRGPRR